MGNNLVTGGRPSGVPGEKWVGPLNRPGLGLNKPSGTGLDSEAGLAPEV